MKLYVMRHGQTNWNVLGKVQGCTDIELNEKGRQQAEEIKKLLDYKDIDLIICSPLIRARQTAEIISQGRDIRLIIDERISERDFGEFEGKQKDVDYDWVEFWDWEQNKCYERAESVRDFLERISNIIEKIKKDYKGKNVLIVTHSGVCAMIYCYFNNIKPNGKLKIPGIKNCELVEYRN